MQEVDFETDEAMRYPRGVFVSLYRDGDLRGCIGQIYPSSPLYRQVMVQAVQAALFDRRFPRVTVAELEEIDVEISVLDPPSSVPSAKSIVVGKHGIVLEKDGHRAVYLPHVASEQGWSLEETLSHLALKAGLAADAWKEGATFEVFEAQVFGEKERQSQNDSNAH